MFHLSSFTVGISLEHIFKCVQIDHWRMHLQGPGKGGLQGPREGPSQSPREWHLKGPSEGLLQGPKERPFQGPRVSVWSKKVAHVGVDSARP